MSYEFKHSNKGRFQVVTTWDQDGNDVSDTPFSRYPTRVEAEQEAEALTAYCRRQGISHRRFHVEERQTA